MDFLTNLKQFFGLGAPPAAAPADALPARPSPEGAEPVPSSGMPQTPQLRDRLYRFIIDKLAPYVNERNGTPVGLRLWVQCADADEEERMAVALYAGQPGQFRAELSRRLADQYIVLALDWSFSWQFVRDALPADCTYRQGNLGLEVLRPSTASEPPLPVRIRTLTGQTAEVSYLLDPAVQTEIRIGRGRTVETASGRVRTNDIVFLDAGDPAFDPQRGEPNGSVSRQHATLRYDPAGRRYHLLADAGGLPANGNKTKILRANDTVERVDLPGVGYGLAPGDQIELGGDAKLLVELV